MSPSYNCKNKGLPIPFSFFRHLSLKTTIIGDIDRPEFAGVLHSVRVYPDSRAFVDLCSLETWIQTTLPLPVIDVILILQSYTGEHQLSVLERIRRNYPITPVVAVLGSWCEGELRTGWPLAGVHRVYGNDWVTQGENEFFSLASGKFSMFGLPPTYKEDEILLEQIKRTPGPTLPANRQCWIFTCRSISRPDFGMSRMLQTWMRQLGFSTSIIDWDDQPDRDSPPERILWEPGLLDGNAFAKIVPILKELRAKFPHTKIFLQTNSLRIDEIRTLYENDVEILKLSNCK